jgi:rod shape determining protein RodA
MAIRVEAQPTPSVAAEIVAALRRLDFALLGAVAALVAYGLWVLASVSRNDVPGDEDYYVVRQGINVALGALGLAVVAVVNPEVLRPLRRPLYAVMLAVLAVVFVTGAVRGSQRWIDVGFFRFQPSELGKVLLLVVLASFLADRSRRLGEWRTTGTAVALAAVPTFLVFMEPDFGTALVYAAILVAALFVAGTRWSHLAVLGLAAGAVAVSILWVLPSAGIDVLRPYQLERLTGFLNPDLDPSGATYNVTQSVTAVGSGGLDGRGIAGATQTNLNYLPEHTTDFIFSSLAEQRGFLGAALLLLLYALIVWRGVKTIALAPSLFTAVLAAGIVVTFVFQVFVNVGMTIGIAPITGIPLPFVSYGGSSMVVSLLMIGLLQAIHVRGRLASRG